MALSSSSLAICLVIFPDGAPDISLELAKGLAMADQCQPAHAPTDWRRSIPTFLASLTRLSRARLRSIRYGPSPWRLPPTISSGYPSSWVRYDPELFQQ